MHIAEGLLPPEWALTWAAVAAPFVVKGIADITRKTSVEVKKDDQGRVVRVRSRREAGFLKPLLGIFTAAVFIISLLPIPVPITGTSSHMGGTPLAGILLGPFVATVLGGIAMFFQALFFAHGGLTTLGANILSEGVAGPFVAVAIFFILRKLRVSLPLSGAVAGVLGDLAIYVVSSGELALALHGAKPLFAVWGAFLLAYMPTQAPLSLVEGVLTGGVLQYLLANRPDILVKLHVIRKDEIVRESVAVNKAS